MGELVDFDEVVEVGDELDLVGLQGGEEKEVVRRRKKKLRVKKVRKSEKNMEK